MRTGLLLTQTNVNKITYVTDNCTIVNAPVTTGTGVAANFFSRPLKTLRAVMQYFMAAFFVGNEEVCFGPSVFNACCGNIRACPGTGNNN